MCRSWCAMGASLCWWPGSTFIKPDQLERLRHNHRAIIRCICGTKARDKTSSVSLLQDITIILPSGRLRWYGHTQRAPSCIKSVTDIPLPVPRGTGRPREIWSECVKTDIIKDISECGLTDRDAWRASAANPHYWHEQHPYVKIDMIMQVWRVADVLMPITTL